MIFNNITIIMTIFFIGCAIGIYLFQKPMEISFNVSILDGILLAMQMYVNITIFMLVEILINELQLETIGKKDASILKIISKLLDSGLLIVVYIVTVSCLFGKKIKDYNLDLNKVYNENVVKIYFSFIVIINCIWIFFSTGFKFGFNGEVQINMIGRTITWALSILGTWFGIGYRCEGRIKEQIKKNKKITKHLDWKQTIKYSIPFVFLMVFCVIFYTLNIIDYLKKGVIKSNNCMIALMLAFGIGIIFSCWIQKIIWYPSTKESDRRLVRAIRKSDTDKLAVHKYESIEYILIKKEKEYRIDILKRYVVTSSYNSEINEIYGNKHIKIKEFVYSNCRNILRKTLEERRELAKKIKQNEENELEEQLLAELSKQKYKI